MSQASDHARKAAAFVANEPRAAWHDSALWFIRSERDTAAGAIPEWETLRERASEIKAHVVHEHADDLKQFAEMAEANGAVVHWALDAEQHNEIVLGILQRHNARKVVKSKSMLTEECHLNPCLEEHGIEVVDTDLGERIVQLRKEAPSHIVLPAIHIKKEQVGECFHEHLGTEQGASDLDYLTEAAREHLREKFIDADVGITGVNFAIAETGGIVICTNEGNADLGTSLPKVHIACMGIEKLVPRGKDLGVFLRLLARSATGQLITTYSSHFHGPVKGGELHLVLVDNGRTELRRSDQFRRSLSCIRCGACMNTCPVYRRSGGQSLWDNRAGTYRLNIGPLHGCSAAPQPALCLQLVRLVHRRLPREDRLARSAAEMARSDCRPKTAALAEAMDDDRQERDFEATAVGQGAGHRAAGACRPLDSI